jgi:16S rRNA (guanine966-N2)-methyltransferase
MRVIAGTAKGRRLKTPVTGTRPMTDRIKESLFSALGDLTGLTVLDLYAGSGSLGLEAISRGARSVTFVENSRDAIVKLDENIAATGFESQSEVLWADVTHTLGNHAEDRVDIIFLDPPYSMSADEVLSNLESLVRMKLTAFRDKDRVHLRDMLDVGLLDASWPARLPEPLAGRLQELIDNPE